MQSQYSANLLFIASMCFSKLALTRFVHGLTPSSSDRRIAVGLEVFIVFWAVAGTIASAFQCKPSGTWDYLHGQCFDLVCRPVEHTMAFTVLTADRRHGGTPSERPTSYQKPASSRRPS